MSLPSAPSQEERKPLDVLLGTFLDLKPKEGRKAFLLFIGFYLVILAYYLIKPATRALMMETFGGGNLPLGNFTTAWIIGFVVIAYDALAGRFRRQKLVAAVLGLCTAALLILWLGLHASLGIAFRQGCALSYFVFADVYSVLGVTLFWSLAHDLCSKSQGERLYGFIGAGGALGGISGGVLAGLLVPLIGTVNLCLLPVPIFGLLVHFAGKIPATDGPRSPDAADPTVAPKTPDARSGIEGLRLIARNRYLQFVTALVGLVLFGSLIVETQFNLMVEEAIPKTDDRAAFLGYRDTQLTVVQFLTQALLTGPMVRYLGISGTLLVLPLGDLLLGIWFFLSPSLFSVNIAKIFDGSVKYGTNQVTKEMLYLPTTAEEKYRAKAFIDIFFHRIAKGMAAAAILFFTHTCLFTKTQLFYPLVVVILIWSVTILALRALSRQTTSPEM